MKQNSKIRIERVCWIIAAGLAVATLVGFLGRFFWLFDLFSHFRVQFFQMALVLVGLAVWKQNRRLLTASFVLACLNYAFVLPLYFGKPPPATGQTTRAMLLNVLVSNDNAQKVLDAITRADPDILVLVEVPRKWKKNLAKLNYPYRVEKVYDGNPSVMLLSCHPLSNTHVVYLGSSDVPTVTATVHLPQGDISVIGTHPLSPRGSELFQHRNAHLAALPQLVAEQTHPVLLIGDLNVSPWSAFFSALLKESGLKNSLQGFGVQPSWPAGNRLLRIPIDHILHAEEITVHARSIGTDIGSDHLPVIVDFSVQ